jgi:hypothetical protein
MKTIVGAMVLLGLVQLGKTQSGPNVPSKMQLYDTIAHLDSLVFSALNSHQLKDVELSKTLFTTDLEFYHDTGGLTGYEQTINFFKTTAESGSDLHRELVPGTMEVYAIPGYGAMQIGQHRFCHTENGKLDCGTFKFVHVWKQDNGKWKIARVVSYGH